MGPCHSSSSSRNVTRPHCRAAGCTELHSQHYCKSCKDTDSNHRSTACPQSMNIKKTQESSPHKQQSSSYRHNEAETNARLPHCKATCCNELHEHHFCKVCKDSDSNHRSNECPRNDSVHAVPHCKARGCTEKHQQHYCKHCQNQDSNHRSDDCPMLQQQKPTRTQKCKVPACTQSHPRHYCRFCEDDDSSHFAIDCPESVILYHATDVQYLEMDEGIREVGLVPRNNNCRFGTGIYFAEEPVVKHIKESIYGENGCVLKCRVWLGKCKDYGNLTDYKGQWAEEGYDSCKAVHPPWFENGPAGQDFTEFVIKNPKKVRIYNIVFKGREFRMYDYVKDKEVLELIKKGII